MTRVLLVCDWFLAYTTEQAKGLVDAGAEVMVVCRDHLQEFGGARGAWQAHIEEMRAAGALVVVIEGRTRTARAAVGARRARRTVLRWQPAIVHAHPNHDPWLLYVARGYPLVVTVHDPDPHPGQPVLGVIRRCIDRSWIRCADAFVVHGAQLREAVEATAGGRRVAVIPHGVHVTPTPDLIPSDRHVLFLGRLEPYKGISVLIEAMDQVWRIRPEVDLTIAGRGPCAAEIPYRPRLRLVVRYIPDDEVARLFAEATVVVAPYTAASQSGVVSLAVGRGVPAVVTDAGALRDLAVDSDWVVPAGDSAALASALLTSLQHGQDVRFRLHRMARTQLSWPVVGRQAVELYLDLLRR